MKIEIIDNYVFNLNPEVVSSNGLLFDTEIEIDPKFMFKHGFPRYRFYSPTDIRFLSEEELALIPEYKEILKRKRKELYKDELDSLFFEKERAKILGDIRKHLELQQLWLEKYEEFKSSIS